MRETSVEDFRPETFRRNAVKLKPCLSMLYFFFFFFYPCGEKKNFTLNQKVWVFRDFSNSCVPWPQPDACQMDTARGLKFPPFVH